MNRADVLSHFRESPDVSVLIVGAGINGVGTFRDLALQGIDVLMIDRGDFSSGASAASSHMAHGGIRYLENGEFRLVREALTERNRLVQNAPHYVRPLPTTIPLFHWFSGFLNAPLKFLQLRDKPSERGAVIIKLGLIMYDLFTRGQQTLPAHRFTSKSKSLELRPKLNSNIICTATYYDASIAVPERICVELIRDAEADSTDARAINYVSLVAGEGDHVTLRDELSGETLQIRPKVVINAAGPWIDFANRAMGQSTRFIGGTKGSHLVLDHPELRAATLDHEIFFENRDGRICLIYPMQDKVMVGTTDIRIDDPDAAACTDDEIAYMLDLVRVVFPDIKVEPSHIVFQFTGVRPLPSMETSTTGQISRDHSIKTVEPGAGITYPVLSLIGGKWTTYRAFSEQVTDAVLARLGRSRRASTMTLAIGGGRGYPRSKEEQDRWVETTAAETGLSADRIRNLFVRYGTLAVEIARYAQAGEDSPLPSNPSYSRREIQYLAEREMVIHLDDLLLRRTLIAMIGLVTGDMLIDLAGAVGMALGWTAEVQRAEIARATELLIRRHGVPASRLTPQSSIARV